jgi:serine protease Do
MEQFPGERTQQYLIDLINQVETAVVNITLGKQSLGSGVIVAPTGLILTNRHLTDQGDALTVTLHDGRHYPARIVAKAEDSDLALLKIAAENSLAVLALGDSENLPVGTVVLALGNPFGLGITVTAGMISARERSLQAGVGPLSGLLQTDAAINPGNSGGPLVNWRGEVVGIATAVISGGSGIGFAVPIERAKPLLRRFIPASP